MLEDRQLTEELDRSSTPIGGDEALLKLWKNLNVDFELNRFNGPDTGAVLKILKGSHRFCCCAVHAVNHYHSADTESLKPADLFTGGLALALAQIFEGSAVTNRRRHKLISPHEGTTAAEQYIYKTFLPTNQTTFIDLHGCRDDRPFVLALGTSGTLTTEQQTLVQRVVSISDSYNIGTVAINPRNFAANPEYTLTSRLKKRGYSSVLQIEIARRFRSPILEQENALKIISIFRELFAP